MQKYLASTLATLLAISSLAACGSAGSASTQESNGSPSAAPATADPHPNSSSTTIEVANSDVSHPKEPGGPAIAVAHDTHADTVSVLSANGSTLGTVAVPKGLVLARSLWPTRFVYGLAPDGSLTVVDAATITVATYTVPAALTTLTEINGSTVALSLPYAVGSAGAGDDVVLVDLETGDTASLRDLVGRPDAQWARVSAVGDNVVLADTNAWRSVVIPQSNPRSAWEADSIIRAQTDGTFVGYSPTSPVGGVVAHVYRGSDHAPVPALFDQLDASHVVGAFPLSDAKVIVALDTGTLTAIDLESGAITAAGELSFAPESVSGVANGLQIAATSGAAALIDLATSTVIEVNDDGTYIDYGSGSKCALIERDRSSYSERGAIVIELASGHIIAELGSEPTQLAQDGCSAIDALRTSLVVDGQVVALQQGWFFDLDSKHTAVLFRAADNVTSIVQLSDSSAVAVPAADDYHFVEV